MLIALVVAAQRLPWLVVTVPAGVMTDRHDRRRIMVACNSARAALTALVAVAVLWRGSGLPGPDELEQVVGTEVVLYLCVLVATVERTIATATTSRPAPAARRQRRSPTAAPR